MRSKFLVVPQWQGSGNARAMRLADGAAAIGQELPPQSTTTVPVPLGAGSSEGTAVQRLSSVRAVRDALARQLREGGDHVPIVIGGGCGVQLAAVSHALTGGRRVAVLWFDAHGDLNTPQSSPSGSFDGMVLRTLLGDGDEQLLPHPALPASRLLLVGARSLDPEETQFIQERSVATSDASDAAGIRRRLEEMDAEALYIHIDLDVLDPAEFLGLADPVPFGAGITDVIEAVRAARGVLPLVGAGITGYAPGDGAEGYGAEGYGSDGAVAETAGDDIASILRLIGSLTRAA